MSNELDYGFDKNDVRRNRRRLSVLGGIFGLLAALTCGWQLLWLMMWGIWGAPANPLHAVGMLGAAFLFFASIAMLKTNGRGAAIAVVIAVVPMWIFFGPALFLSLSDIGEILIHFEVFDVLLFIPSLLLVTVTVLAILRIRAGG